MFRASLLMMSSLAAAGPALAADPLTVISTAMVELRVPAPDGSMKVSLVAASRAVPGDRVVFVVAYRNDGAATLSDVTIANPLSSAVAYQGAATGSPEPEVSVDGKTFGPLGSLTVVGAQGARAVTADDVIHLRWRLTRPLAPGAHGEFAFRARLK